jgi:hypothetical protein
VPEGTAWERSVEKARLALLKTFEGRVEAAIASIEQIPFVRGGDKQPKLAQFCLDAGIEYSTMREYRNVTKWLGSRNGDPSFDEATARYRTGDIGTWSVACEGYRGSKWKTGTLFAAFLDATEPPAPFKRWTVDALRVHLGHKPTNTGTLAIKLAEGEKITPDDEHAAAAKDHAAEVAREVSEIKSNLTKDVTIAEAEQVIEKERSFAGDEFDALAKDVDNMFGPMAHAHYLAREYVRYVEKSEQWLERHGEEIVGGDTDDPDDRPEKIADIARDAFAEDAGIIQAALAKVGVGTSIEAGIDSLLNG